MGAIHLGPFSSLPSLVLANVRLTQSWTEKLFNKCFILFKFVAGKDKKVTKDKKKGKEDIKEEKEEEEEDEKEEEEEEEDKVYFVHFNDWCRCQDKVLFDNES